MRLNKTFIKAFWPQAPKNVLFYVTWGFPQVAQHLFGNFVFERLFVCMHSEPISSFLSILRNQSNIYCLQLASYEFLARKEPDPLPSPPLWGSS